MAIADRLVVLNDGHIQQIGSPEAIYNHPKNRFVAGFIGKPAINFLEVPIASKNHRYFLKNDTLSYEISKEFYSKNLSTYKKMIIGIRPSAIKLVPVTSKNALPATISFIEKLGDENHVYLSVDLIKLTAKTSPDETHNIGDQVHISFEENDIYLFDSETGQSLRSSI